MKKFFTFLLYVFSFQTLLFGQQTDTNTVRAIDEVKLLKDQQQKQIDSLVKIQLRQQLKEASGDQKKTRELEAKLKKISISDSLRNIEQAAEIKRLKVNARGYPVVLNKDTLFYIYTRTGSFSATERAQGISRKIANVYGDAFFSPDSLILKSAGDNVDILYKKGEIILSVSNLDGPWFGKTNFELAKSYLHTLKTEIQRERASYSLLNWSKRIGLAILILVLLGLLVSAIKWVFRKALNYIIGRIRKRKTGLKIGSIRMIPAKDLELVAIKINAVYA